MAAIDGLTIGKLAKMSDVNVETIRYYQKKRLILEPPKPVSGFRAYPFNYVERIYFIKRAQQLGFTLKQIQELLDLGDGHCSEVQELASEKILEIENRLKDLKSMKKSLQTMLEQCQQNKNDDSYCALVSALSQSRQK